MIRWYTEWLLFIPLLSACEKDTSTPAKSNAALDTIIIRSGTNYGNCMGYCTGELCIRKSQSSLQRISNNGQKMLTKTWHTDPAMWKSLISKIDTQQLASLLPYRSKGQKVGTEWLDVQYNGRHYQIGFNLSDTIPAIAPLLSELHHIYIQEKKQ